MNYISGSQSNSSSGNSYNAQSYNASQSSGSTFGKYANLASGVLSTMGPYGVAASAALQIAKIIFNTPLENIEIICIIK